MRSGTFDLARPPVRGAGHGTGTTAHVLVAIAAIRTIKVSTAPRLQTSDDFVAFCGPFSRPTRARGTSCGPKGAVPALRS